MAKVTAKCVGKIRDKNNNITDYVIEGMQSKSQLIKAASVVKSMIMKGELEVINLTLTSDKRLVDRNHDKASIFKNIHDAKEFLVKAADVMVKSVGGSSAHMVNDNSYGEYADLYFNISGAFLVYDQLKVKINLAWDKEANKLWVCLTAVEQPEIIHEDGIITKDKNEVQKFLQKYTSSIKDKLKVQKCSNGSIVR